MNKPRKQTIEKYTKFLEELAKISTISKPVFYEMIKKFHLNNGLVGPMVELGYIKSINTKTFKVCLLKVMPIHAVELLYRLNSSRGRVKDTKVDKQKVITAVPTKIPVKNKKKDIAQVSSSKPVKQFSILWGAVMIKW